MGSGMYSTALGQFICDRCNRTVEGQMCEECKREARCATRIFHDFRRTAVRNMVPAEVLERLAMRISVHKTRSIFHQYNIVNEADLRKAMQHIRNVYRKAHTHKSADDHAVADGRKRTRIPCARWMHQP